ncbi:hypothetical protein GVN16_09620 [Emticicia sp. CRIBPO]|nr:hypothetical protein [Emticicia sp. CRIBPO]
MAQIHSRFIPKTLRTSEADALMRRTIFPEVPPRAEYNITKGGNLNTSCRLTEHFGVCQSGRRYFSAALTIRREDDLLKMRVSPPNSFFVVSLLNFFQLSFYQFDNPVRNYFRNFFGAHPPFYSARALNFISEFRRLIPAGVYCFSGFHIRSCSLPSV